MILTPNERMRTDEGKAWIEEQRADPFDQARPELVAARQAAAEVDGWPMCPRCGDTPLDPWGGAGSRCALDRSIEICSPCGRDEAMRDFSGAPPIPPTDWPMPKEEA